MTSTKKCGVAGIIGETMGAAEIINCHSRVTINTDNHRKRSHKKTKRDPQRAGASKRAQQYHEGSAGSKTFDGDKGPI